MPASNTEYLDYYPPGWTEHRIDEHLVEWSLDRDATIRVRLDGTVELGRFVVTSITGVNDQGEEFVVSSLDCSSEEVAYQVAELAVYGMNGTIGRITGETQYRVDQ